MTTSYKNWTDYQDKYQALLALLCQESSEASSRYFEISQKLAQLEYLLGKIDAAKERAVRIVNDSKVECVSALAHYVLAQIEYTHSNWNQAHDHIRYGLLQCQDPEAEALLLTCRAQVEYRTGNYERSIDDNDLVINQKKNLAAKGIAYSTMGIIYHAKQENTKARKYLDSALTIARKNFIPSLYVRVHNNLGTIEYDARNFSKAVENFNESLEMGLHSNYHIYLGFPYLNLSGTYLSMGELSMSLKMLERSKQAFLDVSNDLMVGCVFLERARINRLQNRAREVEQNLSKALEIVRRNGNNRFMSFIYREFGLLSRDSGDLQQAKYHLSMAREFAYLIQDHTLVFEIENYLETLERAGE